MKKINEEDIFILITVISILSLGLLKELGPYSIPFVAIYPIWLIRILFKSQ
tara:strand:- start:2993 stop:3145 length:153 start_codon:yes stop_codon:yes gene_type:complete